MHSKESQALMEATVDAVIVIDHRGRMTAVNDAACRLFGYRTDELLGENVSLLMPEPDRDRHDGYIAEHLRSGRARIIGIGREVTARRKDGSLFPARLSVGRTPDIEPPRFVGLLRDVTAEHEATAALKLERDRANAYLELNDAILLRLDGQGRISEINQRGADLLGAPRDELRGFAWREFMIGDLERQRADRLLTSALSTGQSREREFDVRVASEARRVYWRCIALRAADGTPSGWLVSGTDVTERIRKEEDAALAQKRLTRVAQLATMGELAAGVAHELNQPLTAITTYARACDHYLGMAQPDFAELREAVREIGAEGLRAGRIIERLRQLVRNDSNEDRHWVDVNDTLEELRALLNADARVFDTRLELELGSGLPRVEGNAVQLQQVVLNLMRNAFEAQSAIPTEERLVRLTTGRASGGEVEVRVIDSGPGIPREIVDRLFHPFATTKKNGTGLGLAMSRTIVQSHGGSIGVERASPRGTCVFVRLPVSEEAYA